MKASLCTKLPETNSLGAYRRFFTPVQTGFPPPRWFLLHTVANEIDLALVLQGIHQAFGRKGCINALTTRSARARTAQ